MVTRLFESRSFKFLKSMEKIYLSLDRYNELKQELAALKKSGREEMAQKLKNAKEFGDLSENFEYQEAKEEQSWLERKIFQLEETLRGAVIIKGGGKEKVGIGSTVHLKIKKDGKILVFKIVGFSETHPSKGLISNASPLGRALLGKKIGDFVSLKMAKGEVVYEILAIE